MATTTLTASIQLLWIWLLVGLQKPGLCVGDNSTNTTEDDKIITLTNCRAECSSNDSSEGISTSGGCTRNFTIRWSDLRTHRVSKHNLSDLADVTVISTNHNERELLKCPNTTSIVQFTVPAAWQMQSAEKYPVKGFFTFFSEDGHFQYDKHVYSPERYCIERITPEEVNVLACDQTSSCTDINNTRPCLPRCCNYGEAWDISSPTARCKHSGKHKWKPKIDGEDDGEDDDIGDPILVSTHPRDLIGQEGCSLSSFTFESPNRQLHMNAMSKNRFGKRPFKILPDGTVWMKLRKLEWIKFELGEYCIDGFQYGEGNYSGDNDDSLLFECKELESQAIVEGKQRQRVHSLTYGVVLTFCLCFLVMTAIVYLLLWEKHNIHGWTVFGYLISLIETYLMLGTYHFASVTLVRNNGDGARIWTLCGLIGLTCHFCYLSTFSWSTVTTKASSYKDLQRAAKHSVELTKTLFLTPMHISSFDQNDLWSNILDCEYFLGLLFLNADLWSTFRRLKPTSGKSSGRMKFYISFALGVPALICGIGIALDLMYSSGLLLGRSVLNSMMKRVPITLKVMLSTKSIFDCLTVTVYSSSILLARLFLCFLIFASAGVADHVTSPEYGRVVCYVEPRAHFHFIILPTAVLLGINLVFFSSTAYSVYNVKKATRFATASSTKKEANNQTFRLILKLLVVNGSVWIVDILSWQFQTGYEEAGVLSFVLDIINALQAVAIFFIFVFKNDILEALKRKYPRLKGIVDAAIKIKTCGWKNQRDNRKESSAVSSYNTRVINETATHM